MKTNKYGYPKIESEKQYWDEYDKWKRKLKKIKPHKNGLEEYINLLDEGLQRELIDQEFHDEKINRLNKEIMLLKNFKGDISEKKIYLKRRLKKLFKK